MSKKLFLLCLSTMIIGTGFAAQPVAYPQLRLADNTFVDFPQPYFNQCGTLVNMAGDIGSPTVPIPLNHPFVTKEAIADVKTVLDQPTKTLLAQFVGSLLPLRSARALRTADFLAIKPHEEDDEPPFDRLDVMCESFANGIVPAINKEEIDRQQQSFTEWAYRSIAGMWTEQSELEKAKALIAATEFDRVIARKFIDQNSQKIFVPIRTISTYSSLMLSPHRGRFHDDASKAMFASNLLIFVNRTDHVDVSTGAYIENPQSYYGPHQHPRERLSRIAFHFKHDYSARVKSEHYVDIHDDYSRDYNAKPIAKIDFTEFSKKIMNAPAQLSNNVHWLMTPITGFDNAVVSVKIWRRFNHLAMAKGYITMTTGQIIDLCKNPTLS